MLGQVVVSGLSMGAIYALVALGYAFVWKTMNIVNFAAGEFLTFGAFIFVATFVTQLHLPFYISAPLAMIAMACLGAAFSRIVFSRLQKQRTIVAIIATVGFGLFLKEMARIIYGPEPLLYPGPFGFDTVTLGSISISKQQLLVFAVVIVIMVLQYFVLRYTMMGKVMRAVAQDRETAALMGIPVNLVLAGTFAYASVLSALGGILLAPMFFVTTELGTLVGLKGFVAMIIGGFGSIPGAILGGLILGLGENVAAFLISSTYKDAIAFVVLLVFLLVRPEGLIPEASADRA
ncbi:branched-chain amino acid ABC transporter permease [Brucella pseudintermedia]|uniref:Branched-chain amino acid ABC transporter permease n=1 Tax=Brucella pseudintermedia TaxID=370111 RepID=A0ABY5UEP0_9HYPH|nr:branched-chain amino acid ABC transporter permease [Brucella pseudintermedia]UWL61825.1 branched-chain amino acid ABC transporter permease [Brucella pseudintermedia]